MLLVPIIVKDIKCGGSLSAEVARNAAAEPLDFLVVAGKRNLRKRRLARRLQSFERAKHLENAANGNRRFPVLARS